MNTWRPAFHDPKLSTIPQGLFLTMLGLNYDNSVHAFSAVAELRALDPQDRHAVA
jgi:hypothetical protein